MAWECGPRGPRIDIVHETEDELWIRDIGPWERYLSITNGVEEVLHSLTGSSRLGPNQRLVYYDSNNEMGEILHDGMGGFIGYAVYKKSFTDQLREFEDEHPDLFKD